MANKRVSQLTTIVSPDNSDLFLLTDISEAKSNAITFSNLKSSVIDSNTFNNNRALIVSALNTHNPNADGKNTLRATSLFFNGEYREAPYFLSYANLTGKPTIPSDLSQLANSTGFVRYNTSTSKMIRDGATIVNMTSDFVNEGQSNLFYTNARADARVEALFGELFNTYNSTFDRGTVRDSVNNEQGEFIDVNVTGQAQSKTIKFKTLAKRTSFSEGQVLRLYGASSAFENTTNSTTFSLLTLGFLDSASTLAGYTKMSYKIAQFDIESGEISAASAAQSRFIKTPSVLGETPTLQAFNSTNFIRLSFAALPVGKGLAVYRQVDNTGDFKLIAVLGRKEVEAPNGWIDYYMYDYTSWSGKSAIDNSFINIVHFSLTAPATASRGWVDTTIVAIKDNSDSFDVTLDSSVFVNSANSTGAFPVYVFHNDSSIIRNAILSNSIAGKKSVILNAKTYNTSLLTLPDDFGLVGTPYITKMIKLPWSGGEAGVENCTLITPSKQTNSKGISIVGVDIDGNAQNQFLFPDETVDSKNYLLNFGTGTNSLLIDKVRITNLPAGGIYATSSVQLKINTSEIVDSGLTDRYSYSPLIADAGRTTMITGNRFENFSRHIDLSVTNRGVFANNIVGNCGDEFGQGVFIYGSVFFLSSPNVLIGPAGEFLPTPDILNSEYDLVNINLQEAATALAEYFPSPNLVYQENGAVFDLTQTAGSISNIEYRAFLISKNLQGVEEIYGTTYTPANFTAGKRYVILSLGTTTQQQWNTCAGTTDRVYAVGSEFVCAAVSVGTGTATSGGVDGIIINDRPAGMIKSLGQFAFSIPSTTVQAVKTANGAFSNTTLKSLNPQHQGIGWSASYRYEVKAADIVGTGAWVVDAVLGTSPTYVITTTNTQYLAINQKVRFKPSTHLSWSNSGGAIEGIVLSITDPAAGQSTVIIRFPGAGGGTLQANAGANGLIAGTGGQLNIIDTFVMAQGRII